MLFLKRKNYTYLNPSSTNLEKDIEYEIIADSVKVTSPEFIQSIHDRFYHQMPEQLRIITNPNTNQSLKVVPGQFRNHDVQVGRHIPPHYKSLPNLMNTFQQKYDFENVSEIQKLTTIAASHHRLMWIHPFSDGNGRVTRLLTGGCMKKAKIEGYGIWSINRGFARFKKEYLTVLSDADTIRQGNFDGRGNLSQKGLDRFCHFFLTTCLDQINFMASLLQLDNFLKRVEKYIELRSLNLIPNVAPIKKEAFYLLKEAILCGEFPRGQTQYLTGLKERTARNLLKQLTNERILSSNTPRGLVGLEINSTLLPYWFPQLVEKS